METEEPISTYFEDILNKKFNNDFAIVNFYLDFKNIIFEFCNIIDWENISYDKTKCVKLIFNNIENFQMSSFENEHPYKFPKMVHCIDYYPSKYKIVISAYETEYIFNFNRYEWENINIGEE